MDMTQENALNQILGVKHDDHYEHGEEMDRHDDTPNHLTMP